MCKPVQAGLFLARLRTLKYFASTSGSGQAYRVDTFCTFCSQSCLAAEEAESEYYLPYSDFSGTTPDHISPRHSQTYIYAWVTSTRR